MEVAERHLRHRAVAAAWASTQTNPEVTHTFALSPTPGNPSSAAPSPRQILCPGLDWCPGRPRVAPIGFHPDLEWLISRGRR